MVDARVGSRRNQPTAFKTGVGWVLMGPDELMPPNKDCYLCLFCCDTGGLNDKMQQLFEQDFCEKSTNIEFPLSVEDKLPLSKVDGSATKLNGHYQIALPWRQECDTTKQPRGGRKAPGVFETELRARCRILWSIQRKINKLLRNGFARKAPSDWKPGRSKVWIIPHHACCTAGKFREVFDCAARFGGVSLNDHLLQGPDLTNGLLGVLLRFQRGRIAFSADIKAMFHQVRVNPKDWDV